MTGLSSSKNLGKLDWLAALKRLAIAGEPVILVTVTSVKGSTPREAGTKMVVTAEDFHGTIGGGHLEYRCLEIARDILQKKPDGRARQRESFPLGPALGQCCGGHAEVLFEAVLAEDVEGLAPDAHSLLITPLTCGDGAMYLRALLDGEDIKGLPRTAMEAGREVFIERIGGWRPQVFLFGAGHVGQAVVRALEPLPFEVRWIDSRAEVFPGERPAHVRVEVTDDPDLQVKSAEANALYLVMTHSHQLDLEICERVLRRGDFAYLGLIGSETKRARFVRRLRIKGVTREAVDRMTCPIGIPGISGKHPAEIAASVSAQLLVACERVSAAQRRSREEEPGATDKSLLRGS
ncbi:xanthine dehydrogenase accessory protein XdhC [Denitrobaculum tricleocarpae]|uniref:Xanthine dehydrogenase accessory protein XdhC n=1 Tax=Denitrobaculum tricleocarpae TaxID=2591009 RepID=A0A545SZ48_9PROT|nr:xanthine dehydrogenase accessory protein XdhC [Denitrobaculum tricleocarpae]TQV70244.1 xanthine dehydrogenase accessory protein XdhC [Denitrobaculum tricleocarpae]